MDLCINGKYTFEMDNIQKHSSLLNGIHRECGQCGQSGHAMQDIYIRDLEDDVMALFHSYITQNKTPVDIFEMIKLIKALDFFACDADLNLMCKNLAKSISGVADDNDYLENIHQSIQRIW